MNQEKALDRGWQTFKLIQSVQVVGRNGTTVNILTIRLRLSLHELRIGGAFGIKYQSGGSSKPGNLTFVARSDDWRTAGEREIGDLPFDNRPKTMPCRRKFARNQDNAG